MIEDLCELSHALPLWRSSSCINSTARSHSWSLWQRKGEVGAAYWESNSSSSSLTHLGYLFRFLSVSLHLLFIPVPPWHIRISLCLLPSLPLAPPCPPLNLPPSLSFWQFLLLLYSLVCLSRLGPTSLPRHSLFCLASVMKFRSFVLGPPLLPSFCPSLGTFFKKFELAGSYGGESLEVRWGVGEKRSVGGSGGAVRGRDPRCKDLLQTHVCQL